MHENLKKVAHASRAKINFVLAGVRGLELIILLAVLAVLGYFLVMWSFSALIHSRKEQVVPDITKQSAVTALNVLSSGNLALKKQGEEFDASVPVGSITRQIPAAGTVVREGKIVRVWFSQGGESVFSPNLIGLPLRNAELLLGQQGLLLGEVGEGYSLNYEKGLVMSQDPKPDTGLAKNALVSVTVSAGAPPAEIILMPDFRQKKLDEVQKWAVKSEVKISITDDEKSLFPGGTVLAQNPNPDSVVPKQSTVSVTVSRRKEGSAAQEKVHRIHYEVSQGGAQSRVRIVMIDQVGEREVFNGMRGPGSKIDLTLPYGGPAMMRIYVNGILVEEKEMP